MRVLFLHRSTFSEITGGVAEFLHYLPLALQAFDVQPYLYSESKQQAGLVSLPPLANGMKNYAGQYIKPGFFVFRKQLQDIIELCQREKIDVIHAQGVYRTGFLALQVYKAIGIPYVVTSHADILATNSERMRRFTVRMRCKSVLKHAKMVTHLTPHMAKAADKLYDTSNKSAIIGNGIRHEDWYSYSTLPEKDYLVAIGRLEKGKGFELLIDVYAELCKKGVSTPLVIAGTGSLASDLKNKAQQLQINVVESEYLDNDFPKNSIIFTGYVKAGAKKTLVAQSKMILFATQPSEWDEAFGIVLLEAMAAKKMIVASHIPATEYLASQGMQAKLVPPSDVKAWVDAIIYVLKNDNEREASGNKNLLAVQQFNWDKIAKQYHNVYLRCLT